MHSLYIAYVLAMLVAIAGVARADAPMRCAPSDRGSLICEMDGRKAECTFDAAGELTCHVISE